MKKNINVECNDLNLILDGGGRVFCDFICYDVGSQAIINFLVPIYEQINEIYRNVNLTKAFVKRLEYKLKLTLLVKPAKLTFVKQNEEWSLQTPLCEIYEPVTLTSDCIKMGDKPLTIDGKVVKLIYHNTKILLLCVVDEIGEESTNFVQTVKTIRITEEINAIYSDKEAKEKFNEILNTKVKNKEAFVNALSDYLEEKIIQLEYDEHYEYSLWTFLYDFVIGNGGNK